eukprot:PLAT3280.33.p1 GENE.PLAT3280.33~~PLAT3280.33.p1  ORF type:complete len:339 (+),score=147.45 PLAT3280.33:22-1038(+)
MSETTTGSEPQLVKEVRVFGGQQQQWKHASSSTQTEMTFSVFLPATASEDAPAGVLLWLSGLTCTDENFLIKAGAQRYAAAHGIALLCPDTSPRGAGVEGEDESYDFGSGAGFYLDATEGKWATHYRMYTYITEELPAVVRRHFPQLCMDACALSGHSMGGHGALTLALKQPAAYVSVSALAPICHPTSCPWGIKAFTGYLGPDQSSWAAWDATLLMLAYDGPTQTILIDQGKDDQFLADRQLLPEAFEAACADKGQRLTLRMQDGYDHSYYFVASVIEDHIDFHAAAIKAALAGSGDDGAGAAAGGGGGAGEAGVEEAAASVEAAAGGVADADGSAE